MNSMLLIIAVLSIVVVAVAAYVFSVAARNYVSNPSEEEQQGNNQRSRVRAFAERSEQDRRRANNVIQFPATLPSGEVVLHDRRTGERRSAS